MTYGTVLALYGVLQRTVALCGRWVSSRHHPSCHFRRRHSCSTMRLLQHRATRCNRAHRHRRGSTASRTLSSSRLSRCRTSLRISRSVVAFGRAVHPLRCTRPVPLVNRTEHGPHGMASKEAPPIASVRTVAFLYGLVRRGRPGLRLHFGAALPLRALQRPLLGRSPRFSHLRE